MNDHIIAKDVWVGLTFFKAYYVGDEVGALKEKTEKINRFYNIKGRANYLLKFTTSSGLVSVHPELFSHMLACYTSKPFSVKAQNEILIFSQKISLMLYGEISEIFIRKQDKINLYFSCYF